MHFFKFFFLAALSEFHHPVFQITDPFFGFESAAEPASVFFSAVAAFFSSVTPVWYFLIVYVGFFGKFLLCSSLLLPRSVSIVRTITFKSLSGKLLISISLGVFFSPLRFYFEVPGVRCLMWGTNPSLLEEKLQICEPLPHGGSLRRG